jgi:hypothetical protein
MPSLLDLIVKIAYEQPRECTFPSVSNGRPYAHNACLPERRFLAANRRRRGFEMSRHRSQRSFFAADGGRSGLAERHKRSHH